VSKTSENKHEKVKNAFNQLDPNLTRVFFPWALKHPRYLRASKRLVSSFLRCKRTRAIHREKGLRVPPLMILSITSKCNLRCFGCYAASTGITNSNALSNNNQNRSGLSKEEWSKIIKESSELGVFAYAIAGGEPFLFPKLLDICKEFNDHWFLIFTNGTSISDEDFKILKRTSNVAVIVSIEGDSHLTDSRRGQGVYERAMKTIKRLGKSGVVPGIAITVTKANYKYWMDRKNIDEMIKLGVRVGLFTEYIPTSPDSEIEMDETSVNNDTALTLNEKERALFRTQILKYREKKRIYLIHSPGDEDFYGGCVSAGRGFAHITPKGDLTPCPVSNIATHNLSYSTVREGLASQLFREIRENEHILETEGTPCALFGHPEEVGELARSVGAYRTDQNGSNNLFGDGTP
jgi:MoaA/NifB/PqqE/SkfB family radical SAM enzyme